MKLSVFLYWSAKAKSIKRRKATIVMLPATLLAYMQYVTLRIIYIFVWLCLLVSIALSGNAW